MQKIFQKAKNTLKISSRNYKVLVALSSVVVTAAVGYFITQAGTFTPPGAPADTWHTLDDIYHRLDKTAGAPTSYEIDSPGAPGATMHTTEDIYTITPNFRTAPGTAETNVKAGENYYKDSSTFSVGTANCVQVDLPTNSTILTGTTICGVPGTFGTLLTWPGSTKRKADCGEAGGIVYDTGSGTICRFYGTNLSCPSGWTQAGNWANCPPNSWGGDWCGNNKSGGPGGWQNASATCKSGGSWVVNASCNASSWGTWDGYMWSRYTIVSTACSCAGHAIEIGCR